MALTPTSAGGGRRRLLLCEGPDDREFFCALIEAHGLQALNYRVRHTGIKGYRGGNSQFAEAIKAYYELEGNKNFRDVLIVSDNDDTPQASFAAVRDQVQSYFGAAPAAPMAPIDVPPRLMIMMLPLGGAPGNLESVCRDACTPPANIAGFTDMFYAQVQVHQWASKSRQDEMWLRSNLAARSTNDPFISLRNIFSEPSNRWLLPLNAPCFAPIVDALKAFAV